MTATERYIVLPRRGVRAVSPSSSREELTRFPTVFSTGPVARFHLENFGNAEMTIHDTAAENGPKLVEMDAEAAARLNAAGSPLRAIKEVFYELPEPAEGSPSGTPHLVPRRQWPVARRHDDISRLQFRRTLRRREGATHRGLRQVEVDV